MKDVRGVELPIARPPRRVVSLVPSITETIFDLGAGASVVPCGVDQGIKLAWKSRRGARM